MENRVLRSLNLSQKQTIELNSTDKIIIVKPHEGLMFKYGPKFNSIFRLLDSGSWVDNEEDAEKIYNFEKDFLGYCIRHPDNWQKTLIVDDDQEPADYQVRFSDFEPDIDMKKLREQGLTDREDDDGFIPVKLTLLMICLKKAGILKAPKEREELQEEVDTFPEVGAGNNQNDNSGEVQGLQTPAV